jgi:hypothetical protein
MTLNLDSNFAWEVKLQCNAVYNYSLLCPIASDHAHWSNILSHQVFRIILNLADTM